MCAPPGRLLARSGGAYGAPFWQGLTALLGGGRASWQELPALLGRPVLQINVCDSGAPLGEVWRRFLREGEMALPGRPAPQINMGVSGAPLNEVWRRSWGVPPCKAMCATLPGRNGDEKILNAKC